MLLRVDAAVALISLAAADLVVQAGTPDTVRPDLVAAAAGVFLLVGLWVPLAGSLIAVAQFWIAFSISGTSHHGLWTHVSLAVLSASVAMLGPGAWSIDARLFGRKRFDIGDRTSGMNPHP